MHLQKKNILIITYTFPPFPGVGGRRWAKFAKYLHRNGHHVEIIAAKNPFSYTSTFMNDIQEIPSSQIHYLPALYPSILLKQPQNIIDKLEYNFWIFILRLLTTGNYYDRSMLWKRQLQRHIRKIVTEKNIQNIVVSGPPFHLCYYTLQLKNEFPEINFIVDYRDEWTFNDVHGFGIIDNKRKQEEFKRENFVVTHADMIISPADHILRYIQKTYQCEKTHLISHAYDIDDFNNLSNNNNNNQIAILFYGTMYPELERFFKLLSESLDNIQLHYPELYHKLRFRFYLINEFKYTDIIKNHISLFDIQYNLHPHQLFQKMQDVQYILIALEKRASHYLTSKFPEIFYMQKPILLYADEGNVSKFIESHCISVHLKDEYFHQRFLDAIQHPDEFNYKNFDVTQWAYTHVTGILERLMK